MKILFIRFSSIGDIVLTTPVIRCVKNQVSGSEIHYLVKKQFVPVLEHNPYINKLHVYDDNFEETLSALKKEKFDVVIDLQKNNRSFRLKSSLGVRHYTFNKLNIKKWLIVNFKINLLPDVHIVDRYMEAVRSLGVTNDGKGLDYFITAKDEAAINSIPETFRNGYIAWVIGAKHFTKRLPIEKIISISKRIISPIILLGGPEDHAIGKILEAENPSKIFNACGKFSLNESAALVKHATKVITHDTGLMHIAAAFNKEIISIWGNTIPEFGMYPYFGEKSKFNPNNNRDQNSKEGENMMLEVKGLSCRPCTKIGYEKCPKGHFKCMREIDEKIFDPL